MFVRAKYGKLVNLDHVSTIENFSRGEGDKTQYFARLYGGDHEILGEIEHDYNLEFHLIEPTVFIPSWPGTTGVMLTFYGDKVDAEDVDIIGWQVSGKRGDIAEATPVLLEAPVSNQKLLCRTSDGQFIVPGLEGFKNIEEAKEYFLDEMRDQERREKERREKANKS